MNSRSSNAVETSSHVREGVEIIPRNPDFNFDDLNKYWALGNPGLSTGLGVFSIVIPEGEKFFIRTVQAVIDQVKDPELLKDIKSFSRQEGFHSKHHEVFNENLKKFGFQVDKINDATRDRFKVTEKFLPKKLCLAMTVFTEHLTALGAQVAFQYPEILEDTHADTAAFWTWHAAEELEHKSVAYNTYVEIGGGYATRMTAVGVMIVFGLVNLPLWLRQKKYFDEVPTDDIAKSLKEFDNRHPGLYKRLIKTAGGFLWAYMKPSFRPWDKDHSDYIEQWKTANSDI